MSATTTPAPAPARMQRFLDAAERRGLQVRESDDAYGDTRSWRIGRDPAQGYVSHVIFAYWSPGVRGGRLAFALYSTYKMRARKLTGRAARSWLHTLAD